MNGKPSRVVTIYEDRKWLAGIGGVMGNFIEYFSLKFSSDNLMIVRILFVVF